MKKVLTSKNARVCLSSKWRVWNATQQHGLFVMYQERFRHSCTLQNLQTIYHIYRSLESSDYMTGNQSWHISLIIHILLHNMLMAFRIVMIPDEYYHSLNVPGIKYWLFIFRTAVYFCVWMFPFCHLIWWFVWIGEIPPWPADPLIPFPMIPISGKLW